MNIPSEWWTEAHRWREAGLTIDKLLTWWHTAELPAQARTLTDLGALPGGRRGVATRSLPAGGAPDRGSTGCWPTSLPTTTRPVPHNFIRPDRRRLNRVDERLHYPVSADIDLDAGPAAELLDRRLHSDDPALAAGAARTIVAPLWRPLAAVGTAFSVSRQPNGRPSLAAPAPTPWAGPCRPSRTHSASVAWVMENLRVDRDQVDALLAAGDLARTEQGRLRIAAP